MCDIETKSNQLLPQVVVMLHVHDIAIKPLSHGGCVRSIGAVVTDGTVYFVWQLHRRDSLLFREAVCLLNGF